MTKRFSEVVSESRITPEGKAQADSKAQHTRQYVSISRGLQRRPRASDGVMKPLLLLLWTFLLVSLPAAGMAADWSTYKQSFISGDGRVMDLFQNSISHSEGQGYGLLLALMNDDRPAFETLWKWTTENLQVRRDALFAWSWGKRANGDWNIIDYNNASDGDILIALALLKAAERWNHPPYRQAAARIVRDIRTHLGLTLHDYQLIAPAYYGFNGTASHAFNTGYLILPAFTGFARVDEEGFWKRTLKDSQRLLEKSTFSSLNLPADWVTLERGQVTVDRSRSPYFGHEAIRVPLYLAWHGDRERIAMFSDYLKFVERAGYLPNRVNLIDGSVDVDEAPAGFYAIMGLCAERLGQGSVAQRLFDQAASKVTREPKNYYSNTLYLLTRGKMD
jgi:endoglucanase